MKKILFLLFASLSSSSFASEYYLPEEAICNVQIISNTEGNFEEAYDNKEHKNYVIAENGERYKISITNNSNRRILAITSVDGLNVITGKKAGFDQQGYVLNPQETTVVDGWRKSLNNTAVFYFTNISDTYAARTYSNTKNVGVIGVACFTEKIKRFPVQPMAAYNDSIAARESLSSKQELGTGHGEIIYSPITTTTFEKSSNRPERTINIYYDSYRNLVKRGVIPQNRCRQYGNYDMCMDDEPIAFPQEPQFDFAPDPRR